MTTKSITAFVDHTSEWHITGTVTGMVKFTKAASVLVSRSVLTINDKKMAVRISSTTESPYLIKKNTQNAELSVVTPEQSKFIRPVETAILSMSPECRPNLTTYLSELLKKKQTRATPFGSRHPKILAKLRIIPQYRHKSLKNCLN